jgi:hypothetical protein
MLPDADETDTLLNMLEDLETTYQNNSDLADQMCEGVALQDGESPSVLAAWTMVTSAIYNLDITKMRN